MPLNFGLYGVRGCGLQSLLRVQSLSALAIYLIGWCYFRVSSQMKNMEGLFVPNRSPVQCVKSYVTISMVHVHPYVFPRENHGYRLGHCGRN